jgi:hypothetical protein
VSGYRWRQLPGSSFRPYLAYGTRDGGTWTDILGLLANMPHKLYGTGYRRAIGGEPSLAVPEHQWLFLDTDRA